jgi:hypothetical protein
MYHRSYELSPNINSAIRDPLSCGLGNLTHPLGTDTLRWCAACKGGGGEWRGEERRGMSGDGIWERLSAVMAMKKRKKKMDKR